MSHRAPSTLPASPKAPASADPARFAEIAVPVPLRRTFTYRIPEDLRERVVPGALVRIPFGRRSATGFVVSLLHETDVPRLKDIVGVEEEEFSLLPEVLELGRWVSEYYLAPLGEVLRAALPAGLGKKSPGEVPRALGTVPDLVLDRHQEAALAAIADSLDSGGGTFLLHGVTGSGKTEVYLRAAAEAVRHGGKVLILIPEIALSPQMVGRVTTRFGHRVALWHSALTPSKRREVWTRTRSGQIDVLVGARSAVFAPLPDLRLVVVDEEHESTYKQSESPRYHARDVALVRARAAGATTVLGSATPSLESFANAERGKYRLLEMPRRIQDRSRGSVELAPIPRAAPGERRPVSLVFGEVLRAAIAETLSAGDQTILFLNRRGHSTVVQCEECREVVSCRNCDIVLTYHASENALRCHYCGARAPRTDLCADCGAAVLLYKGVGTQKVESEIARLFPTARALRLDTDVARRRGTVERTLEAFRLGEADILLGTQMVAKGLDFPRVTLVGVVNADTQLCLPDFRSAERTFQLLTQVAGRSGRGVRPGKVVFQTANAEHYALRTAADQDYAAFYREEMRYRGELNYPPHHRLVNLLFDGKDEDAVMDVADRVARLLGGMRPADGEVDFLGPAPQPVSRLKGKHRWHLTLRGPDHRLLRRLAGAALESHESASGAVRLSVDVDPASLL